MQHIPFDTAPRKQGTKGAKGEKRVVENTGVSVTSKQNIVMAGAKVVCSARVVSTLYGTEDKRVRDTAKDGRPKKEHEIRVYVSELIKTTI